MNRRQHAMQARLLIEACGGLVEAATRCRVGKSQLADYQSPQGETFMPADVMADLEAYCGEPIYSRALSEAHAAARDLTSLTNESCEAAEAASALQSLVRRAVADGRLTAAERAQLERAHAAATAELAQVGDILAREG